MAAAMVEGWVRAAPERAGRILVTDRGSGRAERLAERAGVRHVPDNEELVAPVDVVVLAVKPIDVERVLREVSDADRHRARRRLRGRGRATATLENILDEDAPVFRFMPNVGVKVCAGTLCYARAASSTRPPRRGVLDWLGLLGAVVPLEERQFDAATALSGSGPAFLGLLVEAFEDAGIVYGLCAARPAS